MLCEITARSAGTPVPDLRRAGRTATVKISRLAVGTIIEFNDLKAPDPVEGKPPWKDPQWLAAAEDWIDEECARAVLTRIGPAWGRGRPYSVVARVPTSSGTVWFKANPPAARFEPALLVALADWHPDRFAAPIAVDLDRAWSLTRDGGVTLRAHQSRAPEASTWPEVLRGYARLQADLARHADDLLSFGLADLRPCSVPGQFEKLLGAPHIEAVVGAPGGITRSQHEVLRELTPQLRALCAELDDLGIPASLDHADVHPGNIFAATGIPLTGETRRSRIRSPASSSRCGRQPNRPASRRDPRTWPSSPRATSVPGSRRGTGGQPLTAHSRWPCGLPRSPAP